MERSINQCQKATVLVVKMTMQTSE
jgi:hypothetical protein